MFIPDVYFTTVAKGEHIMLSDQNFLDDEMVCSDSFECCSGRGDLVAETAPPGVELHVPDIAPPVTEADENLGIVEQDAGALDQVAEADVTTPDEGSLHQVASPGGSLQVPYLNHCFSSPAANNVLVTEVNH